MTLAVLAPNLWELNAPLSVLGMALGHRMTVARLPDGGLWVHSPVAHSPALAAELARLGPVANIVAPNAIHDTYLEGWFAAFPTARFHGARGFAKFRPDLKFTDALGDTPDAAWAATFDQHMIRGMPRLNEVAFLHRASHTLILTDSATHRLAENTEDRPLEILNPPDGAAVEVFHLLATRGGLSIEALARRDAFRDAIVLLRAGHAEDALQRFEDAREGLIHEDAAMERFVTQAEHQSARDGKKLPPPSRPRARFSPRRILRP